MTVSFGPSRRVVPNQNHGQNQIAQRRLVEAAARSAEQIATAISVNAYTCRVYLRNIRGTISCPCSAGTMTNVRGPIGPTTRIVLDGGEGDDLDSVDSGYPRGNERQDVAGHTLDASDDARDPVGALQRLLLGNGRRCGICWGTGWIDGHKVWGGNRRIMCVSDAPGVTLTDNSNDPDVDADSSTPTLVGPGSVTWTVRINKSDHILDALRVREGLLPAPGGYVLEVSSDGVTWQDPKSALLTNKSVNGYPLITTGTYMFRLTLQREARVSHVELVSRSEPLVNLQLPQFDQVASAELIAPFLTEQFELDPKVGSIERGTVFDVQHGDGRIGMLWIVSDVGVRQLSVGSIYGIGGNVRSVQPTDTISCASMTDALTSGMMDRGLPPRGLEGSGGGVAYGLPSGSSEHDTDAAKRGSQQRLGHGRGGSRPVIILNNGEW